MVPMLMIDGGCARKGRKKNGAACMESSGNDTGGVIAFPSDPFADANLTTWDRLGPTRWEPCNASAWPSPIWLNPHTHRFNLLAVHGFGEARFEAEDESFTRWKMADEAFLVGMRGLGGGMWHALPPNVPGVPGGRWATHIFQGALGRAFNGLPNFVMGIYDPMRQTYTNLSEPILIDAGGGVEYGQLSWTDDPDADGRCLFVSWLRLAEPTPPDCGTQGQLTLIRDLRFDPRLNALVHTPIAEYVGLRSSQPLFFRASVTLWSGEAPVTLFAPLPALSAGTNPMDEHDVRAMDIEFNVSVPTSMATASASLGVRCSQGALPACKSGANISLGIGTLRPDGTRPVTMRVSYTYHVSVHFDMLKGELSLPLRVLSDVRSLEIFAGGGRGVASITMLSPGGAVTAAAFAPPAADVMPEGESMGGETQHVEVSAVGWRLAL